MATETKLTAAQVRVLGECARHGYACPPGGYSTAGRDASNWWRSVRVLQGLGLVKHPQRVTRRAGTNGRKSWPEITETDFHVVVPTDAGRAALAAHEQQKGS